MDKVEAGCGSAGPHNIIIRAHVNSSKQSNGTRMQDLAACGVIASAAVSDSSRQGLSGHPPGRRRHPAGLLSRRCLAMLVLVLVVGGLVGSASAYDCESLGITGEDLEALEAYVNSATTTVDIGLLIAGGLAAPLGDSTAEVEGVYHMAVTGGMTYTIGLDIDTYCNDLEAPLPPGLGWQLLVATNNFNDIETGTLIRYHGEMNLFSPDILVELGGLYRWVLDGDSAPGVLLSLGFGTQVAQLLVQGQYLFDADSTAVVVAGVRIDAYLFRLLL